MKIPKNGVSLKEKPLCQFKCNFLRVFWDSTSYGPVINIKVTGSAVKCKGLLRKIVKRSTVGDTA